MSQALLIKGKSVLSVKTNFDKVPGLLVANRV